MAAITLDIGGNTSKLDRDIQKTVNKVYSINLKTKGDQPLGRITGKVNEFNKSLDASNARVIAFGASAGIIFGVERAFQALVRSTIEVQKSLADINVILNVSASQLNAFGAQLFNIAKNTGQSFQAVATAATEFSRQGLGVAETLKRTNEALILSRLSGLDTAKSVETLTAAVNSFASQAVTATEIVNKFATVDAAFAISSADLADAISRVGSSAAQSGVSLNELIAIVTSAQQTTARGGAVIGNSFKTIFTRLQREKVVDLLGSLGISSTDATGQVKSTIQLLTELGKVYDTLGSQQQAYVAEQVGGVFQINILKAALADLGKEYSIYNSALNTAATATDQAVKRNEELNKTYAAQINALQQNATQLAALAGERILGPSIDRLVGGTNTLLEGFNENDGKNFGTVLGRGILDGIGQFLAGPGLALIGGVLLKLFGDLAKFATGSFKQLLGLNTAAQQQATLQQSINQILQKNPELINLAVQGENGLNAAANSVLQSLKAQTLELQKQQTIAGQIAKQLYVTGGVRVQGGVPTTPTKPGKIGKAAGYIPNFSSDKLIEKYTAISLGATSSVRPQMSKGTIDGKKFVMNNQEIEFPRVGKNGDSMVIPMYGEGGNLLTASGFIPNFALKLRDLKPTGSKLNDYKTILQNGKDIKGNFQRPFGALTTEEANQALAKARSQKGVIQQTSKKQTKKYRTYDDFIYLYAGQGKERPFRSDLKDGLTGDIINFGFTTAGLRKPVNFKDEVNNIMGDALGKIAGEIYPASQPFGGSNELLPYIDKSATNQFLGRVFEAAVNRAIGKDVSKESGNLRLDIQPGGFASDSDKFQEIFNISKGYTAGDFKFSSPSSFGPKSSELSFARKIAAAKGLKIDPIHLGSKTVKNAARGYIPNFAALSDAISREKSAGIPSSKIYVAQDKKLFASGYNPLGLGVFNTIDEPTRGSRSKAIKSKGYARGFIPNFAEDNLEESKSNLSSVIGALGTELLLLTGALSMAKNDYKSSLEEITQKNKQSSQQQSRLIDAQKKLQRQVQSGKLTSGEYLKRTAQIRAGAPSGMQKFGAGIGSAGTILGFALPIITSTIKQAIPQETKGGRVGGKALDALGTIGGFAGTGAAIGSVIPGIGTGIGAAVGAAAGALLTVPGLISEMFTNLPEFEAAVKTAAQNLTQTSEATQAYLAASAQLQSAIQEGADPEKISKLREQVEVALARFRPEQRQKIESATDVKAAEEAAKNLNALDQASLRASQAMFALQKVNEDSAKRKSAEFAANMQGSVVSTPAGPVYTAMPSPKLSENLNTQELELFTDAIIESSKAGGKAGRELQQALNFDNFTVSDFGPKIKDNVKQGLSSVLTTTLDDIQRQNFERSVLGEAAGAKTGAGALGQRLKSGTLLESRALLEKIIPDQSFTTPEGKTLGKQDIISEIFSGGIDQARQKLDALGNRLIMLASSTDKSVKAQDDQIKKSEEERARKQNLIIATEGLVKSLQSEIQAKLASAEQSRELALIQRDFKLQEGFADKFSRPAELASAIAGENAPITQRLKSKEDVASIVKKQFSEEQSIRSGVASSIGASIEAIFTEIGKQTKTPTLESSEQDLQKAYDSQVKANNSVTSSIEAVGQVLNDFALGTGDIDPNALFENIKTLIPEGANPEILENIQSKIFEETKRGNGDLIKLRETIKGELKTLSKETTQKIMLQKIAQAQTFGGTLDEFLNPPEEGNLVDKALKASQAAESFIDQSRGAFDYTGNQFRYNYPEARQAREGMAVDYGRISLSLMDAVKNLTGYTPDVSSQAYQGALAGITADLDNKFKLIEDVIKNPETSTLVRQQLQAGLAERERLGGTKNIAEIKLAQRTGALSEAGLKRITGSFEDPVLQALQKINPQLAQIKSADIQSTQDPVVSVINTTNDILLDILNTFGGTRINTTNKEFLTPEQAANIANSSLNATRTQIPNQAPAVVQQTTFTTALNNNGTAVNSLTSAIQQLNTVISTLNQVQNPPEEEKTKTPNTQVQNGDKTKTVSNTVTNNFVVNATFNELERKLNNKFTEATERILSILRDNGINAREAPTERR